MSYHPGAKTVERVHEGDRTTTLRAIGAQAKELHDQDSVRVTCPCGADGPLTQMFRCYYCEVWFCPGCAETHFGENGEPAAATETETEK